MDPKMQDVLLHLARHFTTENAPALSAPFDVPGLDELLDVQPSLERLASLDYIEAERVDGHRVLLITDLTPAGWDAVFSLTARLAGGAFTVSEQVAGQQESSSESVDVQSMALEALDAGDLVAAKTLLRRITPPEPVVQHLLGKIALREGDLEEARALMADAAASGVDEANRDLGFVHEQLAELDAAAAAYSRAAESGSIHAYRDLIRVYEMQGNEEAAAAWRHRLDDHIDTAQGGRRLVIPSITGDAVEGRPDLLEIDGDAQALAALIASKQLEPPLAVGLYGEWGSGKTFFMKRVQKNIDLLAARSRAEEAVFHSGIEHVWFSAWHYAEGNLWASLLHHVFASLHPQKSRYRAAFDAAVESVGGARQMTSAATAEVVAANARLETANHAIVDAETRHEKALQKARQLRGRDLWTAVELRASEQGLTDELVRAANELGVPALVETAHDVWTTAQRVGELATRARVLATSGPRYRTPLAYAVYAAVLVGVGGIVLGDWLRDHDQWVGTMAAVLAQVVAIGSAVGTWLTRQAALARKLLAPAEALQQSLEERLLRLKAEHDTEVRKLEKLAEIAAAELAAAQAELMNAEQALRDATAAKAELTGEVLLRRYLAERASSGDYERYMGVIALAHRDLRDLDEHLRAALLDRGGEEHTLDRIVLYIDDLDRCNPTTVTDVLDAVHLLLALRLFVVVVGVDPRWLRQSLRERHPSLLGQPGKPTWTSPTDYLEKIFNLTYTLPHMDPRRAAHLLTSVAREIQGNAAEPGSAGGQSTRYLAPPVTSSDGPDQATTGSVADQVVDIDVYGELAEALTLREGEILALADVAPLVSDSPRRAKRFLSIYLIVKARVLADRNLRYRLVGPSGEADAERGSLLLLAIALCMGTPSTIAALVQDPDIDRSSDLESVLLSTDVDSERGKLLAFLEWRSTSARRITFDEILGWVSTIKPFLPLGFDELRAVS
ncbi:P-loop NTPase fold protein [Kribbella jiaozuonensis]|uniref:KAP NTPase domain-containing protein n=1 Tax=Kribbella jiaozuonensis TaxID=2575441 RepID=A0A4U3M546_9ACTN|nr:P-loop NTPase fold protein [Kribbella jiaozuonensis]TKK82467.1 hypothetical protein FDA38_06675 [Kribbella jiaozuonensis]